MKNYIILLGNKERELVARSVVAAGEKTFPEVSDLNGYWKVRAYVRKRRQHGGLGLFEDHIKKLGVSTWKAWPMPEDGSEPELVKGQNIDADPYGGKVKNAGWENAMEEYAEYVAAKKAEKEAETAKPALPKPTITKVEQPMPKKEVAVVKAIPDKVESVPATSSKKATATASTKADLAGINYALKALAASPST